MNTLLQEITTSRGELPLFTSCTSFEYPDSEYLLFTGEPKLVFEVLDEIPTDHDTPRYFRFVEHNNGESDYVVLVDTFSDKWFEGKSDSEIDEQIEGIMDALEGWYVSEVIDLDSYEE